jgi:PAS domain S-box-containing protein
MALVGQDCRFLEANTTFCRMVGYSEDELTQLKFTDITHPADIDADTHLARQVFEGEIPFYKIEKRYVRKDGETVWTNLTASVVRDDAGKPLHGLAIIEDISERKSAEERRKKLEAQMQQTQKLESLGVLAGGIAHDFNNLLTGVLGHSSLVLRRLAIDSPLRDEVQQIEIAALRMSELANQMLAYSGQGRFFVQLIDLSRLVQEMGSLLDTAISKKAKINYDLSDELLAIAVDASQIRQVVMNLITNASDALSGDRGLISVRTGVCEANEAFLERTYLKDKLSSGRYVYLEVTDTGSGMDEETQAKIFDPFFTTKFTGRGLGLAAVLGIVRGHKGAIKIASRPGMGTTFTVLFPAAEVGTEPPAPDRRTDRAAAQAEATILVVEDEASVRDVATATLESVGYTVLAAQDGREAVDLYGRRSDEIAAVLLDLTMPHMDGLETFRELRRINPAARVILTSGYAESHATEGFGIANLSGFVQKPYLPAVLIDRVQDALGSV